MDVLRAGTDPNQKPKLDEKWDPKPRLIILIWDRFSSGNTGFGSIINPKGDRNDTNKYLHYVF